MIFVHVGWISKSTQYFETNNKSRRMKNPNLQINKSIDETASLFAYTIFFD